jgi:hypothetical protein
MPSRLEQLQKKKQELESRIRAAQEKELAAQRRLGDRRKFLIGEVILRLVERGDLSQDWLSKMLDQELSRKNDRALFSLTVEDPELKKSDC